MEKCRVIEDDIVRADHKILEFPIRRPIISLGGCNFPEIFSPFGDLVELSHFWRATIPSLASQPVSLRHSHFEEKSVAGFIERETTKIPYNRIKASPDSVIALEAAGDFLSKILKIGDSIIPDIRNDIFGPEFKDVHFEQGSDLDCAEVISPDSQYYWDLWRYYFDIFFHAVLKERINRGVDVIFLSRRLCVLELREGRIVSMEHSGAISDRNDVLDDVESFVSQYKGIKIIKPTRSLLFTSIGSPRGGPWEYHPDHAYYAEMRGKFLDVLFPGKRRGERYLTSCLAQNAQSLSEIRHLLARAELALAENTNKLNQTENELIEIKNINALLGTEVDSKDALFEDKISQMSDLVAQMQDQLDMEAVARTAQASENENLKNERDALGCQLQEMDEIFRRTRDQYKLAQEEYSEKDHIIIEHERGSRSAELEISNLQSRIDALEAALRFASNRYKGKSDGIVGRVIKFLTLRFDMRRLRISGFNEAIYLDENPDVKQAKMDGRKHYVVHGMSEGRRFPNNG